MHTTKLALRVHAPANSIHIVPDLHQTLISGSKFSDAEYTAVYDRDLPTSMMKTPSTLMPQPYSVVNVAHLQIYGTSHSNNLSSMITQTPVSLMHLVEPNPPTQGTKFQQLGPSNTSFSHSTHVSPTRCIMSMNYPPLDKPLIIFMQQLVFSPKQHG